MLTHGRGSERMAVLGLLVVTAVWGSTFFLIKDLVTRIPVADLLAIRFGLASLALAVLIGPRLNLTRRMIGQGAGLGLLYGVAQILQTVGLAHTSASVSGFITGLYVVATPVLAAIILKARIGATTWAAVGLATIGLGVLSLNGFAIGYGELVTLVSAVVYAGHIVALGRVSTPATVLSLSLIQMVVITAICGLLAALPVSDAGLQLPSGGADWLAVGYLALVAGALTMTLQTAAQARIEPSRAAVIMAMEPVWAAGFAVALGGESVTARMVVGGLAILSAMYLVELAPRRQPPAGSGVSPREVAVPTPGSRPAEPGGPQNLCAVPPRRSTRRVPVISLTRLNTKLNPRWLSRPSWMGKPSRAPTARTKSTVSFMAAHGP